MSKAAIIKIVGLLVVPIIVMLLVMYLLYPMLNSDRYDLIVEHGGWPSDSTLVDSLELARLDSIRADSLRYAQFSADDSLVKLNAMWALKLDSLSRVVYVLNSQIEGLQNGNAVAQQQQQEIDEQAAIEEEAFKDRVKSLLNLGEDEMAPILEKMSNDQLVLIYTEASTTQREKILRSLSADRAARLITEIML